MFSQSARSIHSNLIPVKVRLLKKSGREGGGPILWRRAAEDPAIREESRKVSRDDVQLKNWYRKTCILRSHWIGAGDLYARFLSRTVTGKGLVML